jgi:cytoskeletal protein CcmA (bactofilin family)
MIKKISFVSIFVTLMIVPFFAQGATFKTGKTYFLVPGSTINDNLYIASGNIGITGTVNGDVLAAGGNISISGPVSGDIAAAGGTINISSDVGGSVRVAGGNINISKLVGGDLVIAGGQIAVMPGSNVGKDAAIAGGSIYIDGIISGNLQVTGTEITLGPNAVIKGTFDYYSKIPATLEQGAVVGGATNFHKSNVPAKAPANRGFGFGLMGIFGLVKIMITFIAALALLLFFNSQVNTIVKKSVSNFWKEALRGFIILVVTPIAIILSFITVIGSLLGIIAVLFYVLFMIISSVVGILLFASLALKYLFKKDSYKLNWWITAVSALALGLISIIPIVGWIFSFIIFISAMGSTSDFVYRKLRS